MCGIFGIISSHIPNQRDIVEAGCRRLVHRGPDGHGIYIRDDVAFGHQRLSIIDLASGAQPMVSPDGRYAITYNGEIYNHLHIREQLCSLGYEFYTSSDTETLLCAYIAWGESCLERLQGMFAFAIADFELREVFIVRDHFGIKPLFYRLESNFFAFCSELPPLVNIYSFNTPSIDEASVALYFRYQYIPSPYTIYSSIRKLEPAHFLRVNFEGKIIEYVKYHECKFVSITSTMENAVRNVSSLVRDAVISSTLSDVPIGVYLSGGIDSTLVAMNLAQSVSRTIPAFTIVFEEERFSEIKYAEKAASLLGLRLNTATVREDDLSYLPQILSYYGEPYGDSSVLPTWCLANLARNHVKVVLSGDGGDELFGGYASHGAWINAQRCNYLRGVFGAVARIRPRDFFYNLKKLLAKKSTTACRWHEFIQYYTPENSKCLLRPPFNRHANRLSDFFFHIENEIKTWNDLDVVQYYDYKTYLPECILPKVDITSMQHGLEVRPSLLSTDILKYAFSLEENLRWTQNDGGKRVLKKILLNNGFDENFVFRQKQGFAIPVDLWFRRGGKARILLQEMISSYRQEISEYLNLDYIKSMLRQHDQSSCMGSKLWLILAFACWVNSKKN